MLAQLLCLLHFCEVAWALVVTNGKFKVASYFGPILGNIKVLLIALQKYVSLLMWFILMSVWKYNRLFIGYL